MKYMNLEMSSDGLENLSVVGFARSKFDVSKGVLDLELGNFGA